MSIPRITFFDLLTGLETLALATPTCGKTQKVPVYQQDVAEYAGNTMTSRPSDIDGWVFIAGPIPALTPESPNGGYSFTQTLTAYGFVATEFNRNGITSLEYAADKAYDFQSKLMEPGSRALGVTVPAGAEVRILELSAPDGFQRVDYRETVVHLLHYDLSVYVKLC